MVGQFMGVYRNLNSMLLCEHYATPVCDAHKHSCMRHKFQYSLQRIYANDRFLRWHPGVCALKMAAVSIQVAMRAARDAKCAHDTDFAALTAKTKVICQLSVQHHITPPPPPPSDIDNLHYRPSCQPPATKAGRER